MEFIKNVQFIFLVLAGTVLLSACQAEDPLYCNTNEDCSEYAYCHEQVCVLTVCKENADCLGGRTCVQGICQFEQNCVGEACCPPPPHAPTETATWPEISAAVPIPDAAYDFTSNPGEVLDKQTCLVWQRYPLGDSEKKEWELYIWEDAKSACLSMGNGWRLPTKVELDSIVDHYKDLEHGPSPTINTTAFPGTPNYGFWNSSEYAGDSSLACYVHFGSGLSNCYRQNAELYVRCVR